MNQIDPNGLVVQREWWFTNLGKGLFHQGFATDFHIERLDSVRSCMSLLSTNAIALAMAIASLSGSLGMELVFFGCV